MDRNLFKNIALLTLLALFSLYGCGVDHYLLDTYSAAIECSTESEVEIEEQELSLENHFNFKSLSLETQEVLKEYSLAFDSKGIVPEAPSTPPPEC